MAETLGHGIAGEALLQAEIHGLQPLLRREPMASLVGFVNDQQSGDQEMTPFDLF